MNVTEKRSYLEVTLGPKASEGFAVGTSAGGRPSGGRLAGVHWGEERLS